MIGAALRVRSRSAEIFQCSRIDGQRQLKALVFSNLRLRGKLEFALRSPFDRWSIVGEVMKEWLWKQSGADFALP
jgi:hypothetical protein